MAWLELTIAGLLEVVWAVGLRFSDGFTRLWVAALTVVAMAASFYYLSRALREIPLGTGYAVWTGIGVAGTTLVGMLVFAESSDPRRMVSVGFILLGILGLRLS